MDFFLHMTAAHFPLKLSPDQALAFWRTAPHLHDRFIVAGADWRADELPGEESWFEELTEEEFESEDFLAGVNEYRFELWIRNS